MPGAGEKARAVGLLDRRNSVAAAVARMAVVLDVAVMVVVSSRSLSLRRGWMIDDGWMKIMNDTVFQRVLKKENKK